MGIVIGGLLVVLAFVLLAKRRRTPDPWERPSIQQRRRAEAMKHAEACSETERLARCRHDREGGFDPFADVEGEAIDGGTL